MINNKIARFGRIVKSHNEDLEEILNGFDMDFKEELAELERIEREGV